MQNPQIHGRKRGDSSERLIDTYLGRQIFLKRVVVENADRGVWLHWSHPHDQGCPDGLKYGHFVASGESLEQTLLQVHQTIEASIELELVSSKPDNEPIDPLSISSIPISSKRRMTSSSSEAWLHLAS